MPLADDVEDLYNIVGDQAPRTLAHSLALRVMATMLQDVLGKRYDEYVENAMNTFTIIDSDHEDDTESREKIVEEFRSVFMPNSP
jgi:hypothetical protein